MAIESWEVLRPIDPLCTASATFFEFLHPEIRPPEINVDTDDDIVLRWEERVDKENAVANADSPEMAAHRKIAPKPIDRNQIIVTMKSDF